MKSSIQIQVKNFDRQQETGQGSDEASPKKKIDPTRIETNPRFVSDIDKANILSRIIFAYAIPMALKGTFRKNKPLTEEDLLTIPWKDRPDTISNRITHYLQERKRTKPHKKLNLSLAILKA